MTISFKSRQSSAIEPIRTIFGKFVDTSQGCVVAKLSENVWAGNRDIRRQTFNVKLVLTQSELSLLHTLRVRRLTFKPRHLSAIEPIRAIFDKFVDTSQNCVATKLGEHLWAGNRDIRRQTFHVKLVLTQSELSLLHTLRVRRPKNG